MMRELKELADRSRKLSLRLQKAIPLTNNEEATELRALGSIYEGCLAFDRHTYILLH